MKALIELTEYIGKNAKKAWEIKGYKQIPFEDIFTSLSKTGYFDVQ